MEEICMEWSYWKVVCKYGHVGIGKEVSVARHLRLPLGTTLLDVLEVAENMPGVKNKGIYLGKKITFDEFSVGRQDEEQNFYLNNLKSFTAQSA